MITIRIAWAAVILAATALSQEPPKKLEPLGEFQEKAEAYVKLRKMVADQLPKLRPTPSAQELAERKAALAASIAKARAGAAQGAIFTPAVAAEFRRLGKLALNGSDGTRVHKSLARAEPVQVAVRANEAYSATAPLQSMPPTLLLGLPKLPMELEYRLVGRTLVLRDVEANLIVDFLPEAIR